VEPRNSKRTWIKGEASIIFWIGRFRIRRWQYNAMPIKILIFWEMEKLIFKFIQNYKNSWIAKIILKKKNKITGCTFPYFKTFKDLVIKTAWSWHKNRHTDWWNRNESHKKSFIYNQSGSTGCQEQNSHFNKMALGQGIVTWKRMKFRPLAHAIYKN
jgi:hypothetical protein